MSQLSTERQTQLRPAPSKGHGIASMLTLMNNQPKPTAKKTLENQSVKSLTKELAPKPVAKPVPQPQPKPVAVNWLDDVNGLDNSMYQTHQTGQAAKSTATPAPRPQPAPAVLKITDSRINAQRGAAQQVTPNSSFDGKTLTYRPDTTGVDSMFNANKPVTSNDLSQLREVMGHIQQRQADGQCGPVEITGNPQFVQTANKIAGEMNVQTIQYDMKQPSFMKSLEQNGYHVERTPSSCAQEAQQNTITPLSTQLGA